MIIHYFKDIPILEMHSCGRASGSAEIVDSETESMQHGSSTEPSLDQSWRKNAISTAVSGKFFHAVYSMILEIYATLSS